MSAPMLEVQGVSKRFGGVQALSEVGLRIEPGQIYGLIGPNGAGKSTTMRMITGFLEPSSGSVELDGISLAEDPIAAKRTFGYLPEGAPAYPDIPAINETVPGFDVIGWFGLLTTAGVPRPILDRLNREAVDLVKLPATQEKFRSAGIELMSSTPEAFFARIKAEIPVWSKIMTDIGIPRE